MPPAPLSVKRKREEKALAKLSKLNRSSSSPLTLSDSHDSDYETVSWFQDDSSLGCNSAESKDSEPGNTWDGQVKTSTPNSKDQNHQVMLNNIFTIFKI